MDVQTGLIGLYTLKKRLVSQTLIESELTLPDGRDASETLLCTAAAAVTEARAAEGRVVVSGRVELRLVCRSMGGDTYAFQAASAFTHTMECEAAEEGVSVEARAQVLECTARPDGLRLRLSAILELIAVVTAPVTTPLITDITGAQLEIRRAGVNARRHALLGETSLRVRDELPAENIARILLESGAAEIAALRYAGSSTCEVEGTLRLMALAEDESGVFTALNFSVPFTCALDAPYAGEAWAVAEVEQLTLRAADLSFGVADVDATLKVRVYGVEENEYAVVLDAYDEANSFSCERLRIDRLVCGGAAAQRFDYMESLLIPKHLPDAATAVFAACMPVVTGLFEKDGKLGADLMLLTGVLYRCAEGTLLGFTEDIPAQAVFDLPYTAGAEISMTVLCCGVSGSGRTLKVAYELCGMAVLFSAEPGVYAVELARGGEPCPYAGLIVYCADAGETLWDIGKRFSVPIAALGAWNADLSEPLSEGQPVVLMK